MHSQLYVNDILANDDGSYWLSTHMGIVHHKDGQQRFLKNEEWTMSIIEDEAGQLWSGRGWAGGGISRFDAETGERLEQLTKEDGLPDDQVWYLEHAGTGSFWIGTTSGIGKYENGQVTNITQQHNLIVGDVFHILQQHPDTVWFAGSNGVYLKTKQKWKHFTSQGLFELIDGEERLIGPALKLPDDVIWTVYADHQNRIWFGTQSRGLVGYDGKAFTVIDSRSGLNGNHVLAIDSDESGQLFIGTLDAGLTVYQTSSVLPSIEIESINIGGGQYTVSDKLPTLKAENTVSIQFQESDLNTRASARQFLIKIASQTGKIIKEQMLVDRKFEWTPQQAGRYQLSVQAIDQDLNYSNKAYISLPVTLPLMSNPYFLVPAFLTIGGLFISALMLGFRYSSKKKEARGLEKRMLQQEKEARQRLSEQHALLEKAYEEAETAKQDAEKATLAKSQFLSNMSHELRTPLNGVVGMASLLQTTDLNEEQQDFVETINASSETLLAIINDILDFSKIEANKLDLEHIAFNLRACIESVLDLSAFSAESKGNELSYFMPEEVPGWIVQDVTRFKQILTNLLSNAIKFTEQGEIRVSVEAAANEDNQLMLNFAIKDTGIGIPDNKKDRLFKSFSQIDASTTRRYGGTGLGLAICKQLSTLMGGDMWFESKEGLGSTFSFSIKAEPHQAETPTVVANHPGREIWLAGFNDFENLSLSHHLERQQLFVQLTASLKEAAQRLQSQHVDLIVACVRNPGFEEEITAFQQQFPDTPVVMVANKSLVSVLKPERSQKILYLPVKPRQLQNQIGLALTSLTNKSSDVTKPSSSHQDEPGASLSVLVADSNTFDQKIAIKMLDQMGYQAQSIKYEELSFENEVDNEYILLVDVDLLDLQALKSRLQEHTSGNGQISPTPFIIGTYAESLPMEEAAYKEAGVTAFLRKPFKTTDVEACMSQARDAIGAISSIKRVPAPRPAI